MAAGDISRTWIFVSCNGFFFLFLSSVFVRVGRDVIQLERDVFPLYQVVLFYSSYLVKFKNGFLTRRNC